MQIRVAGTGIDIAPEMAARLRALAQHPKDNDTDIKKIGQDLNEIGGLEAMQDFFSYACRQSPQPGRWPRMGLVRCS